MTLLQCSMECFSNCRNCHLALSPVGVIAPTLFTAHCVPVQGRRDPHSYHRLSRMSGAIVQLKDRHGNDVFFGNGGDVWFFATEEPDDFRAQLNKIRHMELKDGDVFLVTFPRSGTFWHHQILLMLMNNTTDYIGHVTNDHLDVNQFEKLPRHETPRLYVTHLNRFRLLPQQVKEKQVKVIYSYRNPKDAWVSYYNLAHGTKHLPSYEGTWPQFFDLMMGCGYNYGDWFDHVLDWEKAATQCPGLVFPSCYELMKKDPVAQILKIDQFLGLNRGRQLCEQIADACQFSKLKKVKEAQEPDLHGDQKWKEGAPRFYRKGEIGDWKNWFTVAQSEQLDAVFKKRMSGSKLPFFFE